MSEGHTAVPDEDYVASEAGICASRSTEVVNRASGSAMQGSSGSMASTSDKEVDPFLFDPFLWWLVHVTDGAEHATGRRGIGVGHPEHTGTYKPACMRRIVIVAA